MLVNDENRWHLHDAPPESISSIALKIKPPSISKGALENVGGGKKREVVELGVIRLLTPEIFLEKSGEQAINILL